VLVALLIVIMSYSLDDKRLSHMAQDERKAGDNRPISIQLGEVCV
jgi:hypothetical protein